MTFLLFIVVTYYTFHAIMPSNYFDETSGSLWIFFFVQALGALLCFICHNNLSLYSSLSCMVHDALALMVLP